MIILQNLVSYLKQNKRYALVLVIVLTISFSTIIFFVSANKYFGERRAAIQEEFSAQTFLVQVFYSEEEITTSYSPTMEEFQGYADSAYVKESYLTGTTSINNLTADAEGSEELNGEEYLLVLLMDQARIDEAYGESLLEGTRDLAADECLVSDQFVEENHLQVGDTINTINLEDEPVLIKIKGIFEMGDNQYADLIVPLAGSKHLYPTNEGMIFWDSFFILHNSGDLRSFQNELRDKGLPRFYQVETNQDFARWRSRPITGSQQILAMGTIVSVCLSIFLLFLCSMLFWRKRVYQMKYLYTIGFTRRNIIVQELLVLLLLILGSLVFAYLLNMLFAQSLSQWLLDWQKSLQDTQITGFDNITYIPLPDEGETIQPLKEIQVTPVVNQLIFGIGLIYLISLSFRSIFYALRFKIIDPLTGGGWYD